MTGAERRAAPPARQPGLAWRAGVVAAIALVAALVYSPTLDHAFAYDDFVYVTGNPDIQSLNNALQGFWTTFPKARPQYGTYRPLMQLTFTLDWAAGGWVPDAARPGRPARDPRPFHRTNILIHALATLGVLALGRLLLRGRPPLHARWGGAAEIAALLFAVHPVHVEAVANVVGRAESMMAMFYVAGLVAFVRALDAAGRRRAAWLAASTVLAFCALGTKESAITFPVVCALLWWVRVGLPSRGAPGGRRAQEAAAREGLLVVAPAVGVALFYMLVRVAVVGTAGNPEDTQYFAQNKGLSAPGSMLFVFLFYLRLLAVPTFYYPDYGFPFTFLGAEVARIESPASPWVALGAIALVACVAAFVVLAARRSGWSLPLGLFLVPLGVYSQLIPFGDIAADRFLYLPSVGACLLGGMGVAALGRRWRTPALALAAIIVVGLAVRTVQQSAKWRDVWTFYEMMAERPQNSEAWFGLGSQHQVVAVDAKAALAKEEASLPPEERARHQAEVEALANRAIPLLERAIELFPAHESARVALYECLLVFDPPRYEEARHRILEVLEIPTKSVEKYRHELFMRIARTYAAEWNVEEAYAWARRARETGPAITPGAEAFSLQFWADSCVLLARRKLEEGDAAAGVALLEEARRAAPGRRDVLEATAQVYEGLGRWAEAARAWGELQRADALNPDYARRAAAARQRAGG